MAYSSENAPMREMTPQEHLNQAAANLAGASDELSTTSAVLYQRRADLNVAEHAAMDAQASFDERVREFRQLLDQYGLTVSVPLGREPAGDVGVALGREPEKYPR